ncbi:MAG: DUF2330 domain-containing protein [Candidatus Sericytochromatia bacterium]|nr:DUF2330 domain-containing protein [Candidatus Sericytochromatia bacterium]
MFPKFLTACATGLLMAFSAGPVLACGGFFCVRVPVDQAGERVVFAVDGEEVTAIVQVQYQGPAEQFAWVIPVPTEPKVGVGSEALFARLAAATRPTYRLEVSTTGSCKTESRGFFGFGGATATSVALADMAPRIAEGVTIVSQGVVGPYETATLKSDDPEALVTWLRENGYQIPDSLDPLLAPYIRSKHYFVALRLQKDRTTGDLQPITLKMREAYPCVPIRLTAVAATPNMPITLWVFGEGRAIPRNYRHVHLNEALIDWQGATPLALTSPQAPFAAPAPNYDAVVSQAIAEAGGNGWVTEKAGPTSALGLNLDPGLDKARLLSSPGPRDLAFAMTRAGLPGSAVQGLLRRHLPLPADLAAQGWTESQYWAWYGFTTTGNGVAAGPAISPWNDQGRPGEPSPMPGGFSVSAFVEDLDAIYITPMREAAGLIRRNPVMTRFYTTMSPEQMTEDPTFSFHTNMAGTASDHKARGERLCSDSVTFGEAPIRVTLENGQAFTLTNARPVVPLGTMPAAARIERLFEEGDAELIVDNLAKIADALKTISGVVQSQPGCGCSNPAQTAGMPDAGGEEAALAAGAWGSLVWWRGRRRSRKQDLG